jgi:hypothetical protein
MANGFKDAVIVVYCNYDQFSQKYDPTYCFSHGDATFVKSTHRKITDLSWAAIKPSLFPDGTQHFSADRGMHALLVLISDSK